jgi:4-diphosphocytidyl-2-C-methyl-D-erythritol kinase
MSVSMEKNSPCKVNLLLNILGRRPDGYHELETVMHPVAYCDRLEFKREGAGVELTCSDRALPVDGRNLVHRAATAFLEVSEISEGVKIHLEKRIPLAAGLGGGSGNAATTLTGLNELFGKPLTMEKLHELAARLGSDINFFLQEGPALATGRGEKIETLEPFAAMRGAAFLLVHPGFGISTAWAYQNLGRFPAALNGQAGRARKLVSSLQGVSLTAAGREFYNSLEAPALEKYPILSLFQEWLRENGAAAALMSGSGSTTFAVFEKPAAAETAMEGFRKKFGETNWTVVVGV